MYRSISLGSLFEIFYNLSQNSRTKIMHALIEIFNEKIRVFDPRLVRETKMLEKRRRNAGLYNTRESIFCIGTRGCASVFFVSYWKSDIAVSNESARMGNGRDRCRNNCNATAMHPQSINSGYRLPNTCVGSARYRWTCVVACLTLSRSILFFVGTRKDLVKYPLHTRRVLALGINKLNDTIAKGWRVREG